MAVPGNAAAAAGFHGYSYDFGGKISPGEEGDSGEVFRAVGFVLEGGQAPGGCLEFPAFGACHGAAQFIEVPLLVPFTPLLKLGIGDNRYR